MGFGIISSISGAKAREVELDVLANNIANVQTTGFKEMSISFRDELDKNQNVDIEKSPEAYSKVKQGSTFVNFTQGSIYQTANPLDFALQGDGFFEIQTAGGTRYTRNGHFTVNNQGILVTQQGDPLVSSNGPIAVPSNAEINVSGTGEISSGSDSLGKLRIVSFTDKKGLKPEGGNYYSAEGLQISEDNGFTVAQGHLENSNVNLMQNITRLIMVNRAYESHQKSLSQQVDATKMLNKIATL